MNIRNVYVRQHKRVYSLAMLYLQNVSDAEDTVQNIFMKYMEKEVTFNDESHEDAWFITVTRNYCKDQLRNFWKRKVDVGEIPERAMQETEEGELLEIVLTLPPKYKEVIYLYYYEEYSVREISNILGRNESTIQTQLAAARKKMKKLLEKEGK